MLVIGGGARVARRRFPPRRRARRRARTRAGSSRASLGGVESLAPGGARHSRRARPGHGDLLIRYRAEKPSLPRAPEQPLVFRERPRRRRAPWRRPPPGQLGSAGRARGAPHGGDRILRRPRSRFRPRGEGSRARSAPRDARPFRVCRCERSLRSPSCPAAPACLPLLAGPAPGRVRQRRGIFVPGIAGGIRPVSARRDRQRRSRPARLRRRKCFVCHRGTIVKDVKRALAEGLTRSSSPSGTRP